MNRHLLAQLPKPGRPYLKIPTLLHLLLGRHPAVGAVALALLYGGAGWLFLRSFLPSPDLITGLGWLLAPYLLIVRRPGQVSHRYLLLAVSGLLLAGLLAIKSLYYVGVVGAVLYGVESRRGRINGLPLLLAGALSPVTGYLATTFGFPVRLWLSGVAGGLLQQFGYPVEVSGNLILLQGQEFSVDPACMGLHMLTTSFVLGLFLLAWSERTTGKRLSLTRLGLFLGAIFLLNITANLLRILLLVVFRVLPEDPLHDLLGLLCLALYVVGPLYGLVKVLGQRVPAAAPAPPVPVRPVRGKTGMVYWLLLLGLVGSGWSFPKPGEALPAHDAGYTLPGYQKEVLASGVLKFEKPGVLVYLKPIQGFYRAEHGPMVCWVGSGYVFGAIREQTVSGTAVYTGTLRKGPDLLYTAWWFDNGRHQTISQTDWRWRVVQGEPPFHLVNVSAADEQTLVGEVEALLKTK